MKQTQFIQVENTPEIRALEPFTTMDGKFVLPVEVEVEPLKKHKVRRVVCP